MLLIYVNDLPQGLLADIELFAGLIILLTTLMILNLNLTIDWKTENESLREKCSCSELFWSAFSRIWTEYGEIFRISPYSV